MTASDEPVKGERLPPGLYSPNFRQGGFPETYFPVSLEFPNAQRLAAERRSVRRVMSSSCSHPSPVKECSSSKRKSPRDRCLPCSATSAPSLGKPNISPLAS